METLWNFNTEVIIQRMLYLRESDDVVLIDFFNILCKSNLNVCASHVR